MGRTLLLTGSNRGIGLEAAGQFGKTNSFSKIILTVRSADKGPATLSAAASLSGQPESLFAIQVLDLASPTSVQDAVNALPTNIDAIVLNAGGLGSEKLVSETGVTENFAMNVLGNVALIEGLMKMGKISAKDARVIYSHSETTRSVWGFTGFQPFVYIYKDKIEQSMAQPPSHSTFCMGMRQRMNTYGNSKLIGGLWLSTLAKENPNIYFCSISPGGCADTNVYKDCPPPMSFLMNLKATKWLTEGMGLCHPVEGAAKRYVKAVCDEKFMENFPSGSVVGGPYWRICRSDGALFDQSAFSGYYMDEELQKEASRVVREKLKEVSTLNTKKDATKAWN